MLRLLCLLPPADRSNVTNGTADSAINLWDLTQGRNMNLPGQKQQVRGEAWCWGGSVCRGRDVCGGGGRAGGSEVLKGRVRT